MDSELDPATAALAAEPEPEPVEPEVAKEPSNEPPEGISEPTSTPSQDDYDALVRDREADRQRLATLEADNKALRQPAPAQQPVSEQEQEYKFYSPTELTDFVDKGIITEDQKTQRLMVQVEKRTVQLVREEMQRQQTVHQDTSNIDGYLAILPDLNDNKSENYKRFAEEWSFHASRGLANNDTTKLIALRSAFGSLDRLQKTKQVSDRAGERKLAHGEIGKRSESVASSDGDPIKALSKAEREQYAHLVETGQMTWKEVREDLEFAKTQTVNPGLRMRAVG